MLNGCVHVSPFNKNCMFKNHHELNGPLTGVVQVRAVQIEDIWECSVLSPPSLLSVGVLDIRRRKDLKSQRKRAKANLDMLEVKSCCSFKLSGK